MTGLLVELDPGQKPQDLPKPPSLHGARLRRKVPLDSLTKALRQKLARTTRVLERRIEREIRRSGILDSIHADAQKRGAKVKPTGRGGIPLGPEREAEIERTFRFDGMEAVARLFADEEDAFQLELESVLGDSYQELFNRGGKAARIELGASGSFKLKNTAIADALQARANHLAGDIAEDVFDRLKTVIADQFYLEGKGPFDVARALRGEFDWLSKVRSERIARTETLSVTEEAQHTVYKASGVPFKRWICVEGSTRVAGFGISHLARRWHVGRMVTLRSASGRIVTVTGDHRILTGRGWIPAEEVHEGDDLIRYQDGIEWVSQRSGKVPDVDNVPATIAEVFDSLYQSAAARGMVRRVVDLDHKGRDCEVDVISIDGELRRNLEPSSREFSRQDLLELADFRLARLLHHGALDERQLRHLFADRRTSRSGDAPSDRLLAFAGSTQSTRDGFRSERFTDRSERFLDGGLRGLPAGGELLDREPVAILFGYDRCVRKDVETGARHVYDYTTANQWMVGNGLVIHNCTLDGKERETHFEAHGQIVAIDDPFIVGGAELMFPGDPDGPPDQICNCRCASQPVVTADQVFSDADVWRGDVDPDEFAQDQADIADELTQGPAPPPPSDTGDLNFGDEPPPEDTGDGGDSADGKRKSFWDTEAERLIDLVESESEMFRAVRKDLESERGIAAVERWLKAEREYERDLLGRFGTTGTGERAPKPEPDVERFRRQFGAQITAGKPKPSESKPTTAAKPEPPSIVAGLPEAVGREILTVEAAITRNDYETAAIVDKDGNRIAYLSQGHSAQVQFSPEEVASMRGAYVTHNHPSSRSFSREDLDLSSKAGVLEMRAAANDGTVYRVSSTRGETWPGKERIREEYAKADREVHRDMVARMVAGEVTLDEANREHGHEVWTRVAPVVGLNYSRDESRRIVPPQSPEERDKGIAQARFWGKLEQERRGRRRA